MNNAAKLRLVADVSRDKNGVRSSKLFFKTLERISTEPER
jgi:hypothetical protein